MLLDVSDSDITDNDAIDVEPAIRFALDQMRDVLGENIVDQNCGTAGGSNEFHIRNIAPGNVSGHTQSRRCPGDTGQAQLRSLSKWTFHDQFRVSVKADVIAVEFQREVVVDAVSRRRVRESIVVHYPPIPDRHEGGRVYGIRQDQTQSFIRFGQGIT